MHPFTLVCIHSHSYSARKYRGISVYRTLAAAQCLGTTLDRQHCDNPPDVRRFMFCKTGSTTRSLPTRGSAMLLCTVLCLASRLFPPAAAQLLFRDVLVEQPDSISAHSPAPLSVAEPGDLDDLEQCGEVIWSQTFEAPTIEEQIELQDGVAFPAVPTLATCAPVSNFACLCPKSNLAPAPAGATVSLMHRPLQWTGAQSKRRSRDSYSNRAGNLLCFNS